MLELIQEIYPETMQDFIEQFATERQCRDYLAKTRWSGGFVCPHCKSVDAWIKKSGIRVCKKCRKDVSVTAGTHFAYSKIPLNLWFQAMWFVVMQKQGVSALGLGRALGIKRQKTGWFMLKRIREAMTKTSTDLLSGTVEIDEVFLGGVKPGKQGRGAEGKTLILVAVEDKGKKGIGRIRLSIIPNAKEETLLKTIQTLVNPGSTIRTDQHRGYPIITKHNFYHKPIAKASYELEEDTTPLVHRVASLLKRWLLGTHQGGVQQENLSSYLDEYVFRFNRRTSKSRGKLFYRLIQNMLKQ